MSHRLLEITPIGVIVETPSIPLYEGLGLRDYRV